MLAEILHPRIARCNKILHPRGHQHRGAAKFTADPIEVGCLKLSGWSGVVGLTEKPGGVIETPMFHQGETS